MHRISDDAIMWVMRTEIKKINRNNIDENVIEQAGNILRAGGLVTFPTETVYGLGANALDEEAALKTYAAKGRPSDNPLIVHIARIEDLGGIVKEVPEEARMVADRFWPGPLTMIFEKNDRVPLGTTGGLSTVAVRMPDDEIARRVILAGGGYISAPSANTSGRPSPTTAQHVAEDLDGKIDMILDGGSVDIGVESTILDMTVKPPMILRPGAITEQMLSEVVGEVTFDHTLFAKDAKEPPKAPGMKYRHYAPKAEMVIVKGNSEEVIWAIQQLSYMQEKAGRKVGIIATDESYSRYNRGTVKNIGSRDNEKTIARNLYRLLREFDSENVDYIYSEAFSEDGIGTAIMNRLGKAAGQHVMDAQQVIGKQKYRSIYFISEQGDCRAPVAAELLRKQKTKYEYHVCSRGMVVLFPEPMNPRAEDWMRAQKIEISGFQTASLEQVLESKALILTMTKEIKQRIQREYPDWQDIYTLPEFIGENAEIPNVYGQSQEVYEEEFQRIRDYILKLAEILNCES